MPTQKITSFSLILSLLLMPMSALSAGSNEPYDQDFIITAYYSPLPHQCCYVLGDELADKFLNGDGIHGADGTPVYPGMVAAPAIYPFGTRITLPGLGTVAVHDRGGAITKPDSGADRLDLWVGSGEEGLARALAFGVQHLRGTVYPVGSHQPGESIALHSLSAPLSALVPYISDDLIFLGMHPKRGDRGVAAIMLSRRLHMLGFGEGPGSEVFDERTQKSLEAFCAAHDLHEPGDRLTERTAAFITAALEHRSVREALDGQADRSISGERVLTAKRILRMLGYYRGRTTGAFDPALASAITRFQIARKIISDERSPGAGRIGPVTLSAINEQSALRHIGRRADTLLALAKVSRMLAGKSHLRHPLAIGKRGRDVRELQELLTRAGFLARGSITGTFGQKTRDAVVAYQLERAIIKTDGDPYAGFVGPLTLQRMKKEQRMQLLALVRERGWGVF